MMKGMPIQIRRRVLFLLLVHSPKSRQKPLYEAAWNDTHVPDPIDTSVTDLEETVAQLQADNKELMSRIVATEGSIPAIGNGGSDEEKETATSSSSPIMAAFELATMDSVTNSIMTVVVIIGLVVN